MLHHSPRYGFTLIEMLLVISILAIAIVMSRSLFQNPNQDIIESEVCINTLSSTLESFFLNATLGKSMPGVRAQDGTLHPGEKPDLYVIGLNLVTDQGWGSSIDLYMFNKKSNNTPPPSGGNAPFPPPIPGGGPPSILNQYTLIDEERIERSNHGNFANCLQKNKYHIILSTNINDKNNHGPMPIPSGNQTTTRARGNRILIALSPHDHSFASGGMSILHTSQRQGFDNRPKNPTHDIFINNKYSSFILTYNFCKQEPDYNSNLALANCLPLYKTKFDTRSQTIKHSKCLQYNRSTNQCNKRSIDFDEGHIL